MIYNLELVLFIFLKYTNKYETAMLTVSQMVCFFHIQNGSNEQPIRDMDVKESAINLPGLATIEMVKTIAFNTTIKGILINYILI